MTVKYAIDAVAQRKPGFIPLKAQIPGNTHLFRPVYLRRFIFSRGGGGYFWEVGVGLHRPPHLIFTLFQSSICRVNVREFLPQD